MDRMSYKDLMLEYARRRSLRRFMLPVPVLTPWLSSLWLGLVTPLYARVGRQLIDSIRHSTVVRRNAAGRVFRVKPMDIGTAIAGASSPSRTIARSLRLAAEMRLPGANRLSCLSSR